MNRKIRRNVFETNSSSTHSFTYGDGYNNLIVDDFDNCVHTSLDEFGWEVRTYYGSAKKLDYILLAAANFTNHSFWWYDGTFEEELESFKKTEEYQRIEEAVKNVMNCDGIVIEDRAEGYIDHQSLGYGSFDEWLEDTGADSVEDFIFGNIILHTDNDNYWEDLI